MFDAFVPYYDLDYGSFDDDVLFYRELARLEGGPVLEAMCGTGRVALPLAKAGIKVVGVDIAPAMIKRATDLAAEQGLTQHTSFVVADLRTLDLQQRFDSAFIAINSFMHLETVDDQLQALQVLFNHLNPQGVLALDLFNPDPAYLAQLDGQTILDKTFYMPQSGNLVQKYVIRSADLAAQHVQVTFCYDEIASDGVLKRTVLPFGMRWLYRYELEHLLARCGFVIEHMYGSYDLDAFEGNAERMLVVARRISE